MAFILPWSIASPIYTYVHTHSHISRIQGMQLINQIPVLRARSGFESVNLHNPTMANDRGGGGSSVSQSNSESGRYIICILIQPI